MTLTTDITDDIVGQAPATVPPAERFAIAEMADDTAVEMPAHHPPAEKFASAVGVFLPFLGFVVAVYGMWGWGITWTELILMATKCNDM